jgi:hypothetical protein
MKLRIKGNSIRFRLTQSEVQEFDQTGIIEERMHCPGQLFRYKLQASDNQPFSLEIAPFNLTVFIPVSQVKQWAGSDQVAMETRQLSDQDHELKILIEKDFACLTDRPWEDESDNFPHPDAGSMHHKT